MTLQIMFYGFLTPKQRTSLERMDRFVNRTLDQPESDKKFEEVIRLDDMLERISQRAVNQTYEMGIGKIRDCFLVNAIIDSLGSPLLEEYNRG